MAMAPIWEKLPKAYELKESRYVEELHAEVALAAHKKTGARVLLVCNDDENKVFDIAFRTPVTDDTGVPHIIEHTVLCGSREFPSKDPFVELVKGSLNTFLNAMTYNDKTMYPVASCNDKDFMNLMHVYLDAVFYPNIYKNKMIFEQEGWHYELESPESDLTINGVVYNEMKGAFSSPEQVLFRYIPATLFPDTTYSSESGGDPEAIPTLDYESYLNFHRTYYHPSNSYIYLYGNFDLVSHLEFIDQHYLNDFEYKEIRSEVAYQAPFEAMKTFRKKYAASSEESVEGKTYFSYNAVLGDQIDPMINTAFQILDYVLMTAPGAVLNKALIDAGIGKDVFGSFENGIRQPYYSIVAKDADADQEEAFMQVIRETLNKVVTEGINKKSLEAALNTFEFKAREGDFGRYPRGLMFGLQTFDSWLYDDAKPLTYIEVYEVFEKLRQAVSTDYFEQLVKTYLLDNPHASLLVLEPEQGLAAQKDEVLAEKLAAYKSTLSASEIDELVAHTKALKAFQEEPSTPEELEMIPMIEISDIKKEVKPLKNTELQVEDAAVLYHDVETNGINYFKVLWSFAGVDNELLPYVGLLTTLHGNMSTEKYSYAELTDEINMYTGGITVDATTYSVVSDPDKYKPFYVVEGKALRENSDHMAALVAEMIYRTDFSDTKRVKEMLDQTISRLSMYISNSGHAASMMRALSYFSEAVWIKDQMSGIGYYEFLKDLAADFDAKKQEIVEKLNKVSRLIFRPEHALYDVTAVAEGLEAMKPGIAKIHAQGHKAPVEKLQIHFTPEAKNEGLMTPGMVQFDAIAGNFIKKGYPYHGALQVLKVIMNYDYLWTNIRVKGGAYGCMSGFSNTGSGYLVTYRDPNLKGTYEVFKAAGAYIRNFDCSDRDMTKYIIGAISNTDIPLTPVSEGARSLTAYMSESTLASIQKTRDQLLGATIEDIRSFGDYLDAICEDGYICVVGSESQIKENKEIFGEIRNI